MNTAGIRYALRGDVRDRFSDGLAAVYKDDKYGFINKKGKVVIEPAYAFFEDFSEGLALVGEDGAHWGRYAIRPKYASAAGFSEGLAVVQKKDGTWYVIDKTGKIVVK